MVKQPIHLLSSSNLPVGVSLKSQHFEDVLHSQPDLAFFEVHAENYMSDGGAHHRYLEAIMENYALSIHGVGMSLGSAQGLDAEHLKRFAKLVERYNPALVSEHLAWSVHDGYYLSDLLPLPLNKESLKVVCQNIDAMQQAVGRQILVENPSAYLAFEQSEIPEPEFLATIAENTGCGLLLDVNNVYVSGTNMHWNTDSYLNDFPIDKVKEIHLAGHAIRDVEGTPLLIDDHGSIVCDDVWDIYRRVVAEAGAVPTLVEWDSNIPSFQVLMTEAEKAKAILESQAGEQEFAHYA